MYRLCFSVLFNIMMGLFVSVSFAGHLDPALTPDKSPFIPPKTCKICHVEIYNQWMGSPMANALRTGGMKPCFTQYQSTATTIPEFYYGSIVCIGCHSPEVMYEVPEYGMSRSDYLGEKVVAGTLGTAYTDDEYLQNGLAGITCHHCHAIKDIDVPNYMVLPKIVSFNLPDSSPVTDDASAFAKLSNSIMRGPYRDASTLAPHKVEFSDTHTRSEFCSACHEFNLPIGPNIAKAFGMPAPQAFSYVVGLYLQGQYSPDNDFAKIYDPAFPTTKKRNQGPNKFWTRCCTPNDNWTLSSYSKAGVQCQDCHMRPFTGQAAQLAGEPERGNVYSHYFPGPRRRAVGVGVEEAINTNVKADAAKKNPNEVEVDVTTTNVGAGHRIPNGCPLEVSALIKMVWAFRLEEVSPGRFERVEEISIPGLGSPQYVVNRGMATFDNELFRYDKIMTVDVPPEQRDENTFFGVQHDTGIFPVGSSQGPNSDTRSFSFDTAGADPSLVEIVVAYYYQHPGTPIAFDYDDSTFEIDIVNPDQFVIKSVRLRDVLSGDPMVESREDHAKMLFRKSRTSKVHKLERANNPE